MSITDHDARIDNDLEPRKWKNVRSRLISAWKALRPIILLKRFIIPNQGVRSGKRLQVVMQYSAKPKEDQRLEADAEDDQ
jgi:hypothetical protein